MLLNHRFIPHPRGGLFTSANHQLVEFAARAAALAADPTVAASEIAEARAQYERLAIRLLGVPCAPAADAEATN